MNVPQKRQRPGGGAESANLYIDNAILGDLSAAGKTLAMVRFNYGLSSLEATQASFKARPRWRSA
jgi:hypothetical protein